MKYTQLILIATLLLDSPSEKSPTINYFGEDVSLREVFAEIKNQSDVVFFYDAELIREAKTITIDLKNITPEMALNEIFKNHPLTWTMEGKTVTIYKR